MHTLAENKSRFTWSDKNSESVSLNSPEGRKGMSPSVLQESSKLVLPAVNVCFDSTLKQNLPAFTHVTGQRY